jgi:multiple sugar transport system ATP-binding protein
LARVEIRGVTKRFGEVVAVSDLSLSIEDRAFVVLLGPSGCGKTTVLRCIAGLETPEQGEIQIGDVRVNDLPPKDRDVALVFQSYALYPHMTVFDNISFPLKIRKWSRTDIDKRVKAIGELLRIEHLLNRKPKQLSGGEQQRVALGRALVREPQVFLMDEPLSNLDAKLRLYMRAELKRLQKEIGITTIYVTHDQAEAMTMADRIAIMNKGILHQYESPDEIYHRSANMFVAGFLGSPPMNFFKCTFRERESKFGLEGDSFAFQISKELAELIRTKSTDLSVVIGIRPEDVVLSKEASTGMAVKAEVYVVEPLGSATIVDMKVGDEIYKVAAAGTFKASIGDVMFMCFTENRTQTFDAKTEEYIA